MIQQEEYMRKVANMNYQKFYDQGFATAGHNGPHGHPDTAVRNTSHYLIIYSYLYKQTGEERYLLICQRFVEYLIGMQKQSKSGAIQCMLSDKFDRLNGLIGQGWVIEALIYYYDISHDINCLECAKKIFYSQLYDWDLHLWHRIELDGRDIDVDPTYNHHVWFAACSYKLAELCKDDTIDKMIVDFLTHGAERDFKVYESDGILHHHVSVNRPIMKSGKRKAFIKKILSPIRFINPKKLDPKYMEYAYHLFDFYGFCILKEKYGHLPLFSSEAYRKAEACVNNIDYINRKNGVDKYLDRGNPFNVYGYSYNSLSFEYPYVAKSCGFEIGDTSRKLFDIQKRLMWDKSTELFSKNQPDIETWNARTYEIIRFLENSI